MKIDDVSYNLIRLALYTDKVLPGSVSELWIDEGVEKEIRDSLDRVDAGDLISKLKQQTRDLEAGDRQDYLLEMVSSLEYQLQQKEGSLAEYYESCFGFRLERISEDELGELETTIVDLEKKTGKGRFEIFEERKVEPDKLIEKYILLLDSTKKSVPEYLTSIEDSEFKHELVQNEPWSAFNTHYAPFKSKLSINSDIPLTSFDLFQLSLHEAWGGHHSELSLKDKLLINEGRGEHGIVIVNSPQVYISEGIAEGMFEILGFRGNLDDEEMLLWFLTRYMFALQNLVAHMYFDDKMNKDEIEAEIEKYDIGKKGREAVINFSTDKMFGRYSAVYYSAYSLITDLHEKAGDKESFIKHLFTQPCTPKLLRVNFLNN